MAIDLVVRRIHTAYLNWLRTVDHDVNPRSGIGTRSDTDRAGRFGEKIKGDIRLLPSMKGTTHA